MGQEQEAGTVLHFVMTSLRKTNQRMKTVMKVAVSDYLKNYSFSKGENGVQKAIPHPRVILFKIIFIICSGPTVLMLPAASNKTPMLIGSNGNEINGDIISIQT